MNTQAIELTPAEVPTKLLEAVNASALEPTTGQRLVSGFAPFFRDTKAVLDVSRLIQVTDATQVSAIKASRENRLKLRAIRVSADKCRVALKEDSKRLGDAIQGVYNLLLVDIAGEEKRLQEAEDFAERAEAARKDALKQERTAALVNEDAFADLTGYDLGSMSYVSFANLLEATKLVVANRKEVARKAAEELARKEAERAAQLAEAQRLAAEAAQQAKIEREAREKTEAESKAAAEAAEVERKRIHDEAAAKLAAERAESERKLLEAEATARAEREAAAAEAKRLADEARAEQIKRDAEILAERKRLKAEAEAREAEERKAREAAEADAARLRAEEAARVAADAKAKAEADEAARKAAQAPDKDKLLRFADLISDLRVPNATTDQGKAVAAHVKQKCVNFSKWIREQAEAL